MTGNDLRRRRKELKLSQEGLGRILNMHARTIMRREQLEDEELDWKEALLFQKALDMWEQVKRERESHGSGGGTG